MADKKLTDEPTLNNATIDPADLIYVADVSASQTKGIPYSDLMAPKSSAFRVVDAADISKKVALDLSNLTAATTRTLVVPDANTELVGTDTTQDLENKTLGTGTKIDTSGSDPVGSLYYRDASGNLVPLSGTSSQIVSFNGSGIPETIPNPAAADATYTVKGVRVLDANAVYYAADAGSTDAYAITLSPAPNAYATGQVFHFKANTVNTGSATLNVNSLGAKTIVKGVSTTLADGDIAAGQFCTVIYDGTNFVLQNPTQNAATNAVVGNKVAIGNTPVTVSATLTETNLLSFSLPANTLGTSNAIQGRMYISAFHIDAAAANAMTLRLKYGGTTVATLDISDSAGTTGAKSGYVDFSINANASASAQVGTIGITGGNASDATAAAPVFSGGIAVGTATEASSGALNVVVTVQFANNAANNDITMNNYVVMKIS